MGQGPAAVGEAYFQVRASVTRAPVDAHATPIVTAEKMVNPRQPTRALIVSFENVTKDVRQR